jgi:hypothetical protein
MARRAEAQGSVKGCAMCGETKPLEAFYRQRGGPQGRHSYCKACYRKRPRVRNDTPEQKRAWNLQRRYGLTPKQYDQMYEGQGRLCGLCDKPLTGNRPVVDHDHNTGVVRAILCHRCNLSIAGMDDHEWLRKALAYIGWRSP